ncbi:hypothetical protein HOY82DRAFT_143697 [Tuber indicum]|nr:hypothetical protein HOY82DRAFT_143697 [Tuber indicum]
MSWRSPTLTTSLIALTSRSSLWPTPTDAPAAYPSFSSYTPAAITSAPVSLGAWTPPVNCQGQAPTLTWDVGLHSEPSVLVLNQFYRTTVTENGEPATSTFGYECFPPGYRWDADGEFYFTPGVCPIGYYEATSAVTSSYTITETEGYCCPSSYSAYSSGIGCYSNLVSHSAPVVRYKFEPASALVNRTTVTFYDALTTAPAFAAATLMASFPSMAAPPQVIRPAILIRYGGTNGSDTSSDFNISTSKVGALKLTTLLSIIAAVVFCIILLCACACYRNRREKRQLLVLVPNQNPTPRPVANITTTWVPTPHNTYPSSPPRYPPPVTAFNPRRPEMPAYVPPPAQPASELASTHVNPFAEISGLAIPRPPPAVPKPPPTPATPVPAHSFGSTGPGHVSPDPAPGDNDDNPDSLGTEEEDALAREALAAIIASALATTESPEQKGPSKSPPKFAVPALPQSQVPSPPPASRLPPPTQPNNNPFTDDIPMQDLPSPARSPALQSEFLNTLFSPAGPSRPRFLVPVASDVQNPASSVAPAIAGKPTREESLANKLDLEPMTLSYSRNTRDITAVEVRECRELVQRLKDGQSSAQRGVYRAVRRMASCRDAWNAEDWGRVLEIVRRLRVQYGIEVLV